METWGGGGRVSFKRPEKWIFPAVLRGPCDSTNWQVIIGKFKRSKKGHSVIVPLGTKTGNSISLQDPKLDEGPWVS